MANENKADLKGELVHFSDEEINASRLMEDILRDNHEVIDMFRRQKYTFNKMAAKSVTIIVEHDGRMCALYIGEEHNKNSKCILAATLFDEETRILAHCPIFNV